MTKGILRLLKGTNELKLNCKEISPPILTGYSDASYENCLDTRRSFAGYLFTLGDSIFCWKFRKQRTVTHSACEVDYIALPITSRKSIWILSGLHQ